MIQRFLNKQRGFSLTELAIVLGVIGVMMGALWSSTTSARQASRLEQAAEQIAAMVDAVRTAYGSGYLSPISNAPNIAGDVTVIVPYLEQVHALAPPIIRPLASACAGYTTATSNYADSPWAFVYDPCGSLRVCAWDTQTTRTSCSSPNYTSGNLFAIELETLDYGSCISMTLRQISIAGLKDICVNGTCAVRDKPLGAPGFPVDPNLPQGSGAYAGKGCTQNYLNTLDFVFTLRTPAS